MSASLVPGEVERLRAHVAALEELLQVYERTTIEQSERLEQALRELDLERTRLHAILMQAPAVIALYHGPDHVITMVNPNWERFVGKRDVLGRRFADVFPEMQGAGILELLDRVYETGEPFVASEMTVPIERGGAAESTYWSFVLQPLAGLGGGVTDILVHATEVTDQVRSRKLVEEKAEELARLGGMLERTNRELDQFAYVASHDLKAPLRGIANLAEWIEEDLGGETPEATRKHFDLLRGRVHRMEALIDGILRYSRAGRVREQPERLGMGELVREAIDLLAPPDSCEIVVADGMPTLEAERLPLQQVWMNLIGNAVKYNAREGARVEIGVERRDGCYEFSVADNGPGIAPEYHERIFGIFQTLEARDKVEGTGIGLSLVKKIVESRGGRVWVESAEGAGCTFRFLWPAHTRAES